MSKHDFDNNPNREHTTIARVIDIDPEKCVNCHACISVCPVKYCNDGSGDFVIMNPDTCIGCGSCLSACTHGARMPLDDFDIFMEQLDSEKDIIAIVAPSAAANFPDQYLNLNGWLKNIGVQAVFDVSFGAELTVKSYVGYIEKNNPETIIAQPCPALVSYIEIYKPELLEYLIPVDSPMLHAIKMIKEYYPEYKDFEVAAISPCLAKKREFETTGLCQYNVGYTSIKKYFEDNLIDLNDFEKTDFDNPNAERAVLFSSPGGLRRTVERWNPDLLSKTRKIENIPTVYEYLDNLPDSIKNGKAPLLVDCLNCEHGCNGGTLTNLKDKPVDEIEYWIEKRNIEMQEFYRKEVKGDGAMAAHEVENILAKYWKEGLYTRTYFDRSANITLKIPDDRELKEIFQTMHKYSEEDLYNCSSCGYNKCEKMAVAIFNGLNKPENCHFYLSKESEIAHDELIRLNTTLEEKVQTRTVELQNKNRLIIDSINYAKRLQKAVLPWESRLGESLEEFFILFKPKDILSGDFYWYHKNDDGFYIAAVDCTGHGIPGSMISLIGYMLLNEIVMEKKLINPADILVELHQMVRTVLHQKQEGTPTDDGMDVCLCKIDDKKRTLLYAGAKRPLYLVRDSVLHVIRGNRLSVGGVQEEEKRIFHEHEINLRHKDMIYLTTDGYFDQFNPDWKRFGSKRFKDIIPGIAAFSVDKQKELLDKYLMEHISDEGLIDDVTVIGIRIHQDL